MASTLGKRKRQFTEAIRAKATSLGELSESRNEDVQDVFRRHFEAHFKPLRSFKKAVSIVKDGATDEYGTDSEWEGLSEPEDGEQIEIIEHREVQTSIAMTKNELKAFMSARPPTDNITAPVASKPSLTSAKDDLDENANFQKDLALQRLLTESHLLDSSGNTAVSGVNRHKATDLRLQSLGAKASILSQEKMPMSHRNGIMSKRSEKEDKRRREARENGIILEKAKSGLKGRKEARRDRGVGAPGVGRFSGGTLRLSKRDIFDIEGPKRKSVSKGGRGRGHKSGT